MIYLQIIVGLVIFGGIARLFIRFFIAIKKSQTIMLLIDEWRKENNYKIIYNKYCYLCYTPFRDRDPKNNQAYILTIVDERGVKRKAWICCSSPRFETKNIQFEAVVI